MAQSWATLTPMPAAQLVPTSASCMQVRWPLDEHPALPQRQLLRPHPGIPVRLLPQHQRLQTQPPASGRAGQERGDGAGIGIWGAPAGLWGECHCAAQHNCGGRDHWRPGAPAPTRACGGEQGGTTARTMGLWVKACAECRLIAIVHLMPYGALGRVLVEHGRMQYDMKVDLAPVLEVVPRSHCQHTLHHDSDKHHVFAAFVHVQQSSHLVHHCCS